MKLLAQLRRRLEARLLPPQMRYGYTGSDGMFRPRVRISTSSVLYRPENIHLEDNVFIGHYTYLDGSAPLSIGEGSQLAAWAGILTHSSHLAIRYYGDSYMAVPEESKRHYPRTPTRIGRFSFLGAKCLILPGLNVGDGVIIGAGALVDGDVPDYAVMRGNPAVQVGDTRELDRKVFTTLPDTYYLSHLERKDRGG